MGILTILGRLVAFSPHELETKILALGWRLGLPLALGIAVWFRLRLRLWLSFGLRGLSVSDALGIVIVLARRALVTLPMVTHLIANPKKGTSPRPRLEKLPEIR